MTTGLWKFNAYIWAFNSVGWIWMGTQMNGHDLGAACFGLATGCIALCVYATYKASQ